MEFHIWVFWGHILGLLSVKNDKKGYFHTSHLAPNTVFSKKKVLNNPLNTLSKLKGELTT